MDELYQKLAFDKSFDLGARSTNSDETSFEVIEGWLNHTTEKVEHKIRVINDKNMVSWLVKESSGTEPQAQSLILRLVLVNVDVADKKILLADSVQQILLKAFGLELAHGYAKSCINNVSAIAPSKEQSDFRSYAFCYAPKIASVWSHVRFDTQTPTDRPFVTQGLIFVQKDEKQVLSKFLESSWNAQIYGTAMLLPLLFSLLLLAGIHSTDDLMQKKVRIMEKATKHHVFKSIDHDKTETDTAILSNLSAQANGCAAKLASTGRRSKMAKSLLNFISGNLDESDQARRNQGLQPTDGCRFLREHVHVLQDRLTMLNVDTDHILKRVQVQINALAAIITHNESLANISLSKSQNKLAHQSYRDSLSMKTLAIVTMFFLPGSFISALFSTQLFNWDSVKPGSSSLEVETTPQFELYWIITILLTMLVFSLYFFWNWLQNRRWNREQQGTEMAMPGNDSSSSLEKGDKANISHASTSLGYTF